MSEGQSFGGKDLRVMRKTSATDNAPTFMCTVTTKALQRIYEYDDATKPNCANPGDVWDRSSIQKSKSWSLNVSGMADGLSYQAMETDAEAGVPLNVQILKALPAAQGGGHWDGAVWFENLQIQSDNGGVVKFSAQMRGEGKLAWTAATA